MNSKDPLVAALAAYQGGRLEEAVGICADDLTRDPTRPEAQVLMGMIRKRQGRHGEALGFYQRALALQPGFVDAWHNLGNLLAETGRPREAMVHYRKALELCPDYLPTLHALGGILMQHRQIGEALACFQRALSLRPGQGEVLCNLAIALWEGGWVEEAVAALRQAMVLEPGNQSFHHNLLVISQFSLAATEESLYRDLRAWNQGFAAPLPRLSGEFPNSPDPNRLLRIGYLSADFRANAVGWFIKGVLANHDRNRVTIHCFHNNGGEDDVTRICRRSADSWTPVIHLDDEALAREIRNQGIDLLVDLSGHLSGNRLLALARRPAPVQITWIGYEGTTGLDAMDYLIADHYEVPLGQEQWIHEEVLRLPHGLMCYSPPEATPDPVLPPVLDKGYVTFGCFNKIAKINREVVAVWARILRALPESKLLLKWHSLSDAMVRGRVVDLFAREGIMGERLELRGGSSHYAMFEEYGEVDVALDPFPFAGGLTTCEAMWMGVPVVTLRGDRFASRHSESHLMTAGYGWLVASSRQEYIAKAVALALDRDELLRIRQQMRGRMLQSPLCDARSFAPELEALYRQAWRKWCQGVK